MYQPLSMPASGSGTREACVTEDQPPPPLSLPQLETQVEGGTHTRGSIDYFAWGCEQMKEMASVLDRIFSASASGMVTQNSSSSAMHTST